jgi:2-haloacid dehalogenase
MAAPRDPAPDIILFDLGNVLLDWQPLRLYRKLFETEDQARWFCTQVCTLDWHTAHDRGTPMADNARGLIAAYPDYEAEIRAWSGRWLDMFEGYVPDMPELVDELVTRGVPLYGLSNLPDEVATQTFDTFPLVQALRDIVVSGAVGVVKPDPAIYKIALARMGHPDPGQVLFIDDVQHNIDAAAELGFKTHRFRNAAALRETLISEKLL